MTLDLGSFMSRLATHYTERTAKLVREQLDGVRLAKCVFFLVCVWNSVAKSQQ